MEEISNNIGVLWVDKYRPKTLDELVLSDEIKKYFKDMINSKNVLNCTFFGPPGIGKSTICRVLCNEMHAEQLFIPCAIEGNVATAQGKLKSFCDAMSIDNSIKIVILDEVDAASATQDSSFQKSLRNLIESAQDDTRFLLNCNFIEKVIEPIKSRCPIVNLKFDKKDLLKRIIYILDTEKITYTKESVKSFIESAFKLYPDIRRIISYLQGCCTSGALVVSESTIGNDQRESFLKELVSQTIKSNNLLNVRQYYLANKDNIQDYVMFGSELYNFVIDSNVVSNPDGILKLTDLLYQLNQCVDKEPQLFGMLTAISKWKN